jgi:glycosyltransferase involved in cell wall biosynthesis
VGDRFVAYFNGPAAGALPPGVPLEARPLGERPARGAVWQEWRLPAAAREDRLDVFFAPAYSCPLRLDVPRVTTIHDLSFFAQPHDFAPRDAWRRRVQARASARASRRVLAVSEFTRREIASFLPEAGGRVSVVPHGSDTFPAAGREAARARLGFKGPVLLSVGSILNRRCLPELLRATGLVARGHEGLTLDVVGENRTEPRLDIARLIEQLGVTANVRLSGFVSEEELSARYAAADVAVYLSEYEGFGMPVLEAMASGVPVVTSSRPATSELFGSAARLVDPRDVSAIAGTIDALLRDAGERHALVARGRALAAGHTWSQAARGTRRALLEAAG